MSKFSCVLLLNLLALSLLFSALSSMYYHRFRNLLKNKILFASIVLCICASILCIVLHYNLTQNTLMAHYGILLCVTMLYFLGMALPITWVSFLLLHLYNDENLVMKNLKILFAPCIIVQILLILNLFFGFFFSVSQPPQNLYIPTNFIAITGIVQFGYVLASLIIYYNFKKRSDLSFFSISIFIIPIIGVFLTSTLFSQRPILFMGSEWPFVAIIIVSLCFSIQNELAFKDNLTQLYNREYLDILITKIIKSNSHAPNGAILIDVNDFKNINDHFGHKEGDLALINIANSIKKAVFGRGIAIRYGGDEFIVFVDAGDENLLANIVADINTNLANINKDAEYEISFSYGLGIFDLKRDNMSEIFKKLDKKMYENKRHLYDTNKIANRRKAR